jgi:hypothetical protein
MKHLILLGDSIFDNAAYTGGGPAVIEQVCLALRPGERASLFAVDGNTTVDVFAQLYKLPADATHLILSVGGNDALGQLESLRAPAGSVIQALAALSVMIAEFRTNYVSLIASLMALGHPLAVCTIYDAIPGVPNAIKTGIALYNDVILREAIRHGLPVLDLRMICTEDADYSVKSPIEPSSQGGAKIAAAMVSDLWG